MQQFASASVVACLLFGCTRVDEVSSVQDAPGPDGRGATVIHCDREYECYSEARALCPDGYELLSTAVVWSNATYVGFRTRHHPPPVFHSATPRPEVVVRCSIAPESVTPPDAPFGYAFGATTEQARAICGSQGHRWSESPGGAECSGAPPVLGIDGKVRPGFCDGHLCTLDLVSRVDAHMDVSLLSEFARIEARLAARYGKPSGLTSRVPDDCLGDRLLACVQANRARYIYQWRFRHGASLWLLLEGEANSTVIRLAYRGALNEPAPDPTL